MRPLVSVVLPIYNVENFLERCITSVVNQSYKNLEIILVDDGSPDKCPIICDEWAKKDDRIKVIHKQNAGLGMARNTGIENATGEFICFFDSDDFVDEATIEKCLNTMEKDESQVVVFGYSEIDSEDNVTPVPICSKKSLYLGDDILKELLPNLLSLNISAGISAWSKMYRTSALKSGNIKFVSEREIVSEDAYFALEFFGKISRASVINENLYYYYKNSNSLTKSYKPDRQVKNDVYLEKSVDYCKNAGYPENVSEAVVLRYHSYTITAIKQILQSGLSKAQKREELYKIFHDKVLKTTLKPKFINKQKATLKLFWHLLSLRQYWLCRIMLLYRLKVKE